MNETLSLDSGVEKEGLARFRKAFEILRDGPEKVNIVVVSINDKVITDPEEASRYFEMLHAPSERVQVQIKSFLEIVNTPSALPAGLITHDAVYELATNGVRATDKPSYTVFRPGDSATSYMDAEGKRIKVQFQVYSNAPLFSPWS